MSRATVRLWCEDEGWGILDSPETPGGCWCHSSALAVQGYRALTPGQDCHLDWERADQDGYGFRAVRAWPAGADPVDVVAGRSNGAYGSTSTLHFDDGRPDAVFPGGPPTEE